MDFSPRVLPRRAVAYAVDNEVTSILISSRTSSVVIALEFVKIIRDPVHGLIPITKLEQQVQFTPTAIEICHNPESPALRLVSER